MKSGISQMSSGVKTTKSCRSSYPFLKDKITHIGIDYQDLSQVAHFCADGNKCFREGQRKHSDSRVPGCRKRDFF